MIENKGLLQKESFMYLGASNKENLKGKIGVWGTGLKYAVSYFLRNNIGLKVFSGEEEIKIRKQTVDVNGISYDEIKINNRKTGITTRLGLKWQLWQALREIVSNAIDEGDFMVARAVTPSKKEGCTRFYIEVNDELDDILNNSDLYFSFYRSKDIRNPTSRDGRASFYKIQNEEVTIPFHCIYIKEVPSPLIVYKKGIRVFKDDSVISVYDYEIGDIEINEERLVVNTASIAKKAWALMSTSDSKKMVKHFLEQLKGTIEESVSTWDLSGLVFSTTFGAVFKENNVVSSDIAEFVEANIEHIVISSNVYSALGNSYIGNYGTRFVTGGDNMSVDTVYLGSFKITNELPENEHLEFLNKCVKFAVEKLRILDFSIKDFVLIKGAGAYTFVKLRSGKIGFNINSIVNIEKEEAVHDVQVELFSALYSKVFNVEQMPVYNKNIFNYLIDLL